LKDFICSCCAKKSAMKVDLFRPRPKKLTTVESQ
jgi:hypothetical protein